MDRHRLKQLRDKVGELHRDGSPSCMRQASSIMRDEFDSVLSFALDLSEPEPKPKRTIADKYPAGGLTATEPCMYCEDYAELEERNEKFKTALTKIHKVEVYKVEGDPYAALGLCKDTAFDALEESEKL